MDSDVDDFLRRQDETKCARSILLLFQCFIGHLLFLTVLNKLIQSPINHFTDRTKKKKKKNYDD